MNASFVDAIPYATLVEPPMAPRRGAGADAMTDTFVAAIEWRAKADAAFKAWNFDAALFGYRKAHEADRAAALLVNQAACLNGLGRAREALDVLDRALVTEAETAELWHQRAISQEQIGRWTSADESCRKALACWKRQAAKGWPDGAMWRVRAECLWKLEHPWLALWAYAWAWVMRRSERGARA